MNKTTLGKKDPCITCNGWGIQVTKKVRHQCTDCMGSGYYYYSHTYLEKETKQTGENFQGEPMSYKDMVTENY